MARVVQFEIHARDPERALAFYAAAFGWQSHRWDGPHPYWVIRTGDPSEPGIDGGLALRHGPSPREGDPLHGAVCTIAVDRLRPALDRVRAAGGTVTITPFPIQGVGWLAYFRDPEGNLFGLMENDSTASVPVL